MEIETETDTLTYYSHESDPLETDNRIYIVIGVGIGFIGLFLAFVSLYYYCKKRPKKVEAISQSECESNKV